MYPRNLSSGLTVIDALQTRSFFFQQREVLPKYSLQFRAKWALHFLSEDLLKSLATNSQLWETYHPNNSRNEDLVNTLWKWNNQQKPTKVSKKTHAASTRDRPIARNILIFRAASVAPTTKTIPYLAKVVNYVFIILRKLYEETCTFSFLT